MSAAYYLSKIWDFFSPANEATHKTAVTVAQTTAAAITTTLATPRGIRVSSDLANTGTIFIGYTGLSLANGTHFLYPGESAIVPCANAVDVFAVSATAAQSLRWEVL
jgi:hypothetical protein